MARKILLADDSVTAQNMGRKILADAGYEVVTVNNGSAALKRIAETKPDLIVLDVYMPGYSGLEVCQRLKESGDTSRIPIVLTVGKLEPFKPEEAKRVRADGFIVKPFEASELLSAISKLEDRIVPRSEAAKPGRFARANAAIDASYDKSVANTDDDSGWKNRIQFPSKAKKKEKEEAEFTDDPAMYNPVNKDLRTTVDSRKAPTPEPIQEVRQDAKDTPRVDLGALAPEGLPKDVTPEEIAALAAAAAQVKGKLSETETGTPEPSKRIEAVASETKVEESKADAARPEEKVEAKPEPQAVPELPKEAAAIAPEPVAQPETKIAEEPAPAIAASAELAPVATIPVNPGNGHAVREDMPVTMAVAAGAENAAIPLARWKAIPVAVLAEEAALSLEEEMRKALAAVAAAEMALPAPITTLAAAPEVVSAPVAEMPAPVAVLDPVAAVASEASKAGSAPVSAAADPIAEAVKDLEAVAASYPEFHKPFSPAEAESTPEQQKIENSAASIAAPAEEPAPKADIAEASLEEHRDRTVAEAKPEQSAEADKLAEEKISEITSTETMAEAKPSEPAAEEVKAEEPRSNEEKSGAIVEVAKAENVQEAPVTAEPVVVAKVSETAAEIPADSAEVATAQDAASASREIAEEPAKPAAAHKSVFGGIDEMGKKESEVAEHTAAAWASWRRIRDDGKGGSSKDDKVPTDDAKAAMAVAAGAEKAPEEAAPGEDSEVSAIVDSVLADLRPKIVEEISRKLGKKK